jgi:hypothetical protein
LVLVPVLPVIALILPWRWLARAKWMRWRWSVWLSVLWCPVSKRVQTIRKQVLIRVCVAD